MLRAATSATSATSTASDDSTSKRDANKKERDEEDNEDGKVVRWRKFMNKRPSQDDYIPTDIEQLANIITHGVWILPSLVGLWLLQVMAESPVQSLAVLIYGSSIFLLFTVSTAFHSLAYYGRSKQLKNFFHMSDRVAIYIFIAASYTPWLALKDFNRFGTLMIWIVWTAAIFGITYQYKYHDRSKCLETLLYVFIATLPSVIIFEMKEPSGITELAAGGVAYFLGVFFFKSDGFIPFAHAIWHILVIVGASIHYVAVCKYLLGPEPAYNSNISSDSSIQLSAG